MRGLAVCAALALGACTLVGPDYQRPASPLPSAYGEAVKPGELAVPPAWWTL
jgi:hypothetical protein